MPKVLCTFGLVLVCLHTFVVVRTNPMGRQTPSSLQLSLKRNLTALSTILNITRNGDKHSKDTSNKDKCPVKANGLPKDKLDRTLARAPVTNTRKVRLYSRYHYVLQMSRGGSVGGTLNSTSPNVLFLLQSVGVNILRIKHVASGRYLGMDKNGILRGRLRPSLETLFSETNHDDGYSLFSSYKLKSWYVAIRRNGLQKAGRHTCPDQKAVQFLVVDYEK